MGGKRRPESDNNFISIATRVANLQGAINGLHKAITELVVAAGEALEEVPHENCYCYNHQTPCAVHGRLADAHKAMKERL